MTTNNALELLPAKVRQRLYVTYGLVVLATGATQVGYSSVENLAQPTWLTVALSVVAFLGVPFAALASTNVTYAPRRVSYEVPEEVNESGEGFSVGHVVTDR